MLSLPGAILDKDQGAYPDRALTQQATPVVSFLRQLQETGVDRIGTVIARYTSVALTNRGQTYESNVAEAIPSVAFAEAGLRVIVDSSDGVSHGGAYLTARRPRDVVAGALRQLSPKALAVAEPMQPADFRLQITHNEIDPALPLYRQQIVYEIGMVPTEAPSGNS